MNKNYNTQSKISLLLVITIGLSGLGINDAFGASPTITAYVANDPDNADAVFGAGDTITISTDIATNATLGNVVDATFVTGNFTFAAPDPLAGLVFTADWTANWVSSTSLEITFININNVLAITTSTVDTTGGNTIGDQTADVAGMTNGAADPLTGDFGGFSAGKSCSRDCTPPTLGPGTNGNLIVTDGFSYNGYPTNVSQWHTEYPLIAVETGKMNILQAKIHDDWGLNNIRAIIVAFGVPEVGSFYNGETIVEYYPNEIIGAQVNVIDKQNLLDRVKITTEKTSCNDSENSSTCMLFTMEHMFREAPLANVVGISVSDKTRNGVQFYFNDGIEVEGDSLNPPQTATVPQHTRSGGVIQLTQIDRGDDIWIDENENIWTKNSYDTWFKLTPDDSVKVTVDPISTHGIDRHHAYFEVYKQGEELLAKQIWNSDEIQAELSNYIAIEYSGEHRIDNPELQNSVTKQIKIAQETFEKEFGKVTSE